MGIFWAILLILFGLWLLCWLHDKTLIIGGFLFCSFLVVGGMLAAVYAASSGTSLPYLIVLVLALLAFFLLAFGLYILIGFLLLNARAMRRREGSGLVNSLPLLFALGLIVLTILFLVATPKKLPTWALVLTTGLALACIFYFFHMASYLATLFLCNCARPRHNKQYIIVLGAGLVDGGVSPLLARRVDKAVRFYNKQKRKGKYAPPKLVLSGGQGVDEPISEAVAMCNYAKLAGVPQQDILLEDCSTNTLENMRFSKERMDADAAGAEYKCLFATSNYHLLRAGVYARQAGLRIDGLGAKTAFYYLPTAILREYIAYVWLHRKAHAVLAGLCFLAGGALPILQKLLEQYVMG